MSTTTTMVLWNGRYRPKRVLFHASLSWLILTTSYVYGFVKPLPAYHVGTRRSNPQFSANDDDEDDNNWMHYDDDDNNNNNDNDDYNYQIQDDDEIYYQMHYDDFDFVVGEEQASAPPDPLQKRIKEFQEDEMRKDAQLAKNWKTGNWKVRGFSLDKYSPQGNDDDNDDSTIKLVHVSHVKASRTPGQVIVGRTDGSVCFVSLGTQYLTQFVGKLTAEETGNATVSIQNELVPQVTSLQQNETPFSVDRQFQAHDTAIVALEEHDDDGVDDQQVIFTASQGSGEIRVWGVPEDASAKITPLRSLVNVHSDTIVALKTLSMFPDDEEENLLFSASRDGSLALWDIQTGDLVYKCQMMDGPDQPASILCGDVDISSSILYMGMATGHVVGFHVQDMIECASEGTGLCPAPSGRFVAHEHGGVTAIACAGEGTLKRSRPGAPTSSILLTGGGADGLVKQWEIMSRQQESSSDCEIPSLKLEHWPRLATQRMQRRAHLFQGHQEDTPITALASIDASKFLSAGTDGTVRAWSPSSGQELFRMVGFTEKLSSLCLQEDMYLITDGMEELVCLHDFDVDSQSTQVGDGYDLEWW